MLSRRDLFKIGALGLLPGTLFLGAGRSSEKSFIEYFHENGSYTELVKTVRNQGLTSDEVASITKEHTDIMKKIFKTNASEGIVLFRKAITSDMLNYQFLVIGNTQFSYTELVASLLAGDAL